MLRLPRIAVGAVQRLAETEPISWALMELLVRDGCQIQHFHARACFSPVQGALPVTGTNSRHLDSWLMSPDICREVFVHGCRASDMALVEGRFDLTDQGAGDEGGQLEILCDWLDLPRLIVLDAPRIEGCGLPKRPKPLDGLLLDRVSGPAEFFRLQTSLEALWGVPVLGGLERLPRLRAAIADLPRGGAAAHDLCRELGRSFAPYAKLESIRRLAARREFPPVRPVLFPAIPQRSGLAVALAYDAAFNCYFPDTLDLLELLGAKVVDFSPLGGEALPPGTDVVYLGCGHPERHAAALAGNHCMLAALRNHVRAGCRIYAEGGGLAYLCQHLETADGQRVPMVGSLPAVARLSPRRAPVEPVELTLSRRTWLGEAGTRLRGYLNPNWVVEPTAPLAGCLAEPGHEQDLVARYQVLGSRLHLNFAVQPEALSRFFKPRALAPAPAGA